MHYGINIQSEVGGAMERWHTLDHFFLGPVYSYGSQRKLTAWNRHVSPGSSSFYYGYE